MTASGARRGRRAAGHDTRALILAAARRRFAADGFDGATVRAIAAEAGVDPAMINHHFGGKEPLFIASVEAPFDPAQYVRSVRPEVADGLAARLLSTLLPVWDSPAGAAAVGLFRSGLHRDWGVSLLRQFIQRRALTPIVEHLPGDDDERALRASLVASQIAGLLLTRYVIKLEPIASMRHEQVVALIAPNLQRYLTGPLT
ncbi:TetR family transcriptional regulator [Tersicoccus solisilvae]|uniref:TetR family transcriptional regulator n=1 Tax=Tersicoccus solisilvae TaxID=1882339 RepID=A0ABQ1NX90_9MICC|nr:TetR family transcriptional regulator [Tersicoccus solisilvae]GGC86893.1 TetR family transcriptional regulator [Tersicoccus solisilvae]